jgi:hypothetical protein
LQILAAGALSGMSEARAALIFWFFFIKEKEHPPRCPPGGTPCASQRTTVFVIPFCLFEEYSHSQ